MRRLLFFVILAVIAATSISYIFFRKKQFGELIPSKDKLSGIYFEKTNLNIYGYFTSLTVGPDHNLYAATINGVIYRYSILNDGKLKLNSTFKPFGSNDKLLIGLTFSPKSTAKNLEAWISYCDHSDMKYAPNWDGRIAKLVFDEQNDKIKSHTLVITNLPRSGKDHLTNSIAFGPDGAIYFNQGSNTAAGKATKAAHWMKREENLLSGAILRLDLNLLPKKLPLDVKTEEGGSYNPFTKNAPLTIYATGLRNAYDLVWHTNGQLYTPLNGASGGGNTPTTDVKAEGYIAPFQGIKNEETRKLPIVKNIKDQNDFLMRIEQGGYYGHPNPLRAEYVINRGDKDVDDPEYNGLKPHHNFREPFYDFGRHVSPNGVIEYKNNLLGGKLKGALMIARFNTYNDIVIFTLDESGQKINQIYDGEPLGLGKLNSALDLTEDPQTGNLYVSEFGGSGQITLFRPVLKSNLQAEKVAKPARKPVVDLSDAELHASLNPQEILEGKKIFQQNCQACHGQDGEGGQGVSFRDTEWIYGHDIKAVYKIIKNGASNGMPAWESRLKPIEMKKVAGYILSLSKTENQPLAKN